MYNEEHYQFDPRFFKLISFFVGQTKSHVNSDSCIDPIRYN